MQFISPFLVFFFFFLHRFIDFEYFSVILGGFLMLWKNLKSKMADPRWWLLWHHGVIVMWSDVIIPCDVYQKIDFQTYYIPAKFHCDCLLLILVWKDPKKPGLDMVKAKSVNLPNYSLSMKRIHPPQHGVMQYCSVFMAVLGANCHADNRLGVLFEGQQPS